MSNSETRFTGYESESFSYNPNDEKTKRQEELEKKLAKEFRMDGPDIDADGILLETRKKAMSEKKDTRYEEYFKLLHGLYHTRNNLARDKQPRVQAGRPTEEDILSLARKSGELLDASRFWALIIGIDKYDDKPLKGCVNDGKLMEEYLTKDLGVPGDHVRSLFDESATRENIINALLDFCTNERIRQRDDIIIIYFAGHGSNYTCSKHQKEYREPGAPKWMACCPVEEICPIDRDRDTSDPRFPHGKIPDISDRDINVILGKISAAKGPRITVILDCCHSGGATREPSDSYTRLLPALSSDVHDDMRQSHSATISTNSPPWVDTWVPDMSSHVVIAACRGDQTAKERATEVSGIFNGVFTRALIETLRHWLGFEGRQLTYSLLLMALPVKPLRYQTPVVAGNSKDKLLWSQED